MFRCTRLWQVKLCFLLAICLVPSLVFAQAAATSQKSLESLSAAEFSRLSREFSEEGGYFRSDNFTSNETAYLYVVDKLKQLGASGGAYLGVGPEQNYTYIAKVRPRIAVLFDIRRQAIVQHLMYKAIFHLSPTRAQFLARLISRQLPKDKMPDANATINQIVAALEKAVADDKTYAANLAEITKTIESDFQYALTAEDKKSLDYIYSSFYRDGLEISYRVGESWGRNYFPTLKEIIVQPDQHGKHGNFLASVDDYEFVRGLHQKNLILLVVGDFGGKKAIATVGDFLRKNGLTVSAFYLSNVEQYLFGSGTFDEFAENVRKLPLTDKSLFIRSVSDRVGHPAHINGHRLTTILQQMNVFLKDFDAGRYRTYNDMVVTNYIAAEK